MTSAGISQKEYLKKYLSSSSDDKKKKKKKLKAKPAVNRLRIVDDDVDIHSMRPLDDDELELYDLQEDAPQIAGIIDERPEEVKIKEKFGSKKWKVVADENDMGVKIIDKSSSKVVEESGNNYFSRLNEENGERDLTLLRKVIKDTDQFPQDLNTKERDSQKLLAPEVNRKNYSDESPPRKHQKENAEVPFQNKKGLRYDSDESPPRKSRKNNLTNSQARETVQPKNSDESRARKNLKLYTDNTRHSRKEQKYNSDESPPRKSRKNDWENMHQSRKKQNYSSDESPLRRNKNVESTSSRRRGQKNNSDESPLRVKSRSNEDDSFHTRTQKYGSDNSSPKRNRKDNSDNAQPRKKIQKYDSDESPPRRGKRSSESPLRKEFSNRSTVKADHRKSVLSPSISKRRDSPTSFRLKDSKHAERRTQKSDSDESPPRKERRRESFSPPSRGSGRDTESSQKSERRRTLVSPHTKNKKEMECKEISRRTSRWGDADDSQGAQKDSSKIRVPSPMRNLEQSVATSSYRDSDKNDSKKDGRNSLSHKRSMTDEMYTSDRRSMNQSKDSRKITLDGRKAGLVGANELKAEILDLRHREKEMFEKMDVSVSGRGAAPIMRDRKTGKKRDLAEEAREKQKVDEKQAERDAKYMQWGKGLKQVSEKAQKLEDALYEMSKPLARYADDADLDKYLREQEREGDPMLNYIRTKSKSEGIKGKPKYEGSFMPNRFSIRPGYRWDGVDRSNGYEKQWFEMQNTKKAVEEEAYKWSTADM